LLPVALLILQFRCANEACGATWRILPRFLARHLWHAWRAVERSVRPPGVTATPSSPPIAARTRGRWLARLASSARMLVTVLATSVGAVLEALAMCVGLSGTRGELFDGYVGMTAPPSGEQLSSLAALVHRLEPGLRLM
jgi:hypothetical protein